MLSAERPPSATEPGPMITFTFTGTQPWDLTFTDGTTPVTVTGITQNPYVLAVSPPTGVTTYTATALSDANCTAQSGDMTGSAVITVRAPLTAPVIASNQLICYNDIPNPLNVRLLPEADRAYSVTSGKAARTAVRHGRMSGQASLTRRHALIANTYYRVVATDIGPQACGSINSNTLLITVNPAFIAPVASANQTICNNTAPAQLSSRQQAAVRTTSPTNGRTAPTT
ncbi:MAG: hypothetical protein MZV63_55985 [Marinilabiliales bacterium]|nr:hypothetical protein [Marinilabiliales bacterium]